MKKKSIKIVKICLSLCFIAMLIRYSDTAELWHQIQRTSSGTLFGGMAIYCLAQVISSVRWQWILDANGVKIPLRTLFASYMAGMFVNNFLPTSIGGDIVKSYDIYRITGNTSLAVVSVFLERFSGLVVLMALSWFGFHHTVSIPGRALGWGWVLLNMLCVIFLLVITRQRNLARMIALLRACRLTKVVDAVMRCHGMVTTYKTRKLLLFKLLALSIPIQLITIFIYKAIASEMDVDLPFSVFLFSVPVITIMALLPISYGGLGVREGVTAYVLSAFGVRAEDGLGIAIVYLGITYMTSLIGGGFFGFRKISAGQYMEIDQN